jgi:porin
MSIKRDAGQYLDREVPLSGVLKVKPIQHLAKCLIVIAAFGVITSTLTMADDCSLSCGDSCGITDASSTSCSWCDQPQLTGEMFGFRPVLADDGITLEVLGTQFYQGITSGGQEQDWEYGGKFDYLVNIDGKKLGMWDGLFVNLHGESRMGQSINKDDGLLTPSNIAMAFPEPEGNITALTGVKITQALSPNFAVYAGKINTLDEYPLRFSPKLGLERPGIGGFMNTSLVFNPILARTVPYAALGVGAAYLKDGEPMFTLTCFDPEERSTIGLQDPYARGVVIMPDLILKAHLMGLPGTYNFGGSYSTAKYTSLDPASYLILPDIGVVGGEETGSWNVYTNFYQALWVDEDDEERTWGVFGQFGLSDGEPNPIRFVANGGIAGASLIPGREYDRFGVGFFYLGLSNDYKALAAPVLPQQDEYGAEMFYNLAFTRWCRLTGDLQIARPSTKGLDTSILPGVRMSILF